MDTTPVLSQEWYDSFFNKADLEASFEGLRDNDHFYAETMRGHIRSLQLRVDEASRHFEKAKAKKTTDTIPNLVRAFMLSSYVFENALLRGVPPAEHEIPGPVTPKATKEILEEFPMVEYVLFLRRKTEGLYRLYLGQPERSSRIFEDLIEEDKKAPGFMKFMYYLGLASSHRNLGLIDSSRRHVENAVFFLQCGFETLNEAKAAGLLFSYFSYLCEQEEAAGWKSFLERLKCPKATKTAFLSRGRRIVERSVERTHIVLL